MRLGFRRDEFGRHAVVLLGPKRRNRLLQGGKEPHLHHGAGVALLRHLQPLQAIQREPLLIYWYCVQ